MVRGTTPPIICKLRDDCPINLNEVFDVHLTIEQGHISITKTGVDVVIGSDGHTATSYLTQEESLSLRCSKAKIQLNWMYPDESGVLRRGGTKSKEIEIDEHLFRKVIE